MRYEIPESSLAILCLPFLATMGGERSDFTIRNALKHKLIYEYKLLL